MASYRTLELFGCAGGMAEGFRRAGLSFGVSIDRDRDACASYEANLGHRPLRMDVHDLLRLLEAGWSAGPLDLIVADPPCTPWSRAGKRLGTADERDSLSVTIELIRVMRPRAYLVGNVPGLEAAPCWPQLQAALAPLRQAGYCIRDFTALDSAAFGVPQHRTRPFWFGHLAGPCVRWPAATHGDPADPAVTDPLPGMPPLRPWVTCRDALSHLAPEDLGRPVRLRRRACHGRQHGSIAETPARTVGTSNLSDGNCLLLHPGHWPNELGAPSRTITAKRRSNRSEILLTDPDGMAAPLPNEAWPWNRPATPLAADSRIPPPGHHPDSGSILSVAGAVLLSERAAAILQGFPEDWQFIGATKRSRWSQLGQAMPPPLAEPVARAILTQLGAADPPP